MKRKNLVWLAVIWSALACSSQTGTTPDAGSDTSALDSGSQFIERAFERVVAPYLTKAECEADKEPGSVFNCLNLLTFCENSGVIIVVTDIINEGRCTESSGAGVLSCTMASGGDLPADFSFEVMNSDPNTIKELKELNPWTEAGEESQKAAKESCSQLPNRIWWNN